MSNQAPTQTDTTETTIEALLKDSTIHQIQEIDGIHNYYILLESKYESIANHEKTNTSTIYQTLKFWFLLDRDTHAVRVLGSWVNPNGLEYLRITDRAALYTESGYHDFLSFFLDQGMCLTQEQSEALRRRLTRVAPFGWRPTEQTNQQ